MGIFWHKLFILSTFCPENLIKCHLLFVLYSGHLFEPWLFLPFKYLKESPIILNREDCDMTTTDDPGNAKTKEKNVIDWSVLDGFLAFRRPGGADPRRRIITIYLDSAPALMEAIKTAISGADGTLLSKSAHSLKSSSMNVGAGGLGSLCAKLERMGREGAISEAKDLVVQVETLYTAVTAALRDALQHMDK
jgi:HPt (histidine-containing phosphotransfer) domain-containing protein